MNSGETGKNLKILIPVEYNKLFPIVFNFKLNKVMNNFSFEEALSYMKSDFKVMGPGGRVYAIVDGNIVCWPKPIERPKQVRVEVKLNAEAVLSNNWSLYEPESK